jgi:PadR family transcriptional regulator, regulatory protein PadR
LLYRVSGVTRTRRPSPRTLAVLEALADEPERWRYGYELCAQLDMQAGSMYPILIRLADRGLLEATWEDDPVPGRPARHLYRLTGTGRAYATAAAASEPPVRQAHGSAASSARPPRRPGLEGA